MRKSRVRALHAQAFAAGRDGSLIVSEEFDRLKKSYKNKSYAKVVNHNPSKPGFSFLSKYKAHREILHQRAARGIIETLRNQHKNK